MSVGEACVIAEAVGERGRLVLVVADRSASEPRRNDGARIEAFVRAVRHASPLDNAKGGR